MSQLGANQSADRSLVIKGSAGLAGIVGLLAGSLAVRQLARVVRHYRRVTVNAVSFGVRAATFNLHRRCPDCKSRIDTRARVCKRCSFRLAPQPEPR